MNASRELAAVCPAGEFIQALRELGQSEHKALRRATGRPLGADVLVYDIFRDIYRPVRRKMPTSKRAFYLVATLYPWHPKEAEKGNFSHTLRKIRQAATTDEGRKRADQRFTCLLNSSGRALSAQLTYCVRLLRQAGIPINWVQLLNDLSDWYATDKKVQKAWAESYFKS